MISLHIPAFMQRVLFCEWSESSERTGNGANQKGRQEG